MMVIELFFFIPSVRNFFARLVAEDLAKTHPHLEVDVDNVTTSKRYFPTGDEWWVVNIPVKRDGEEFIFTELIVN